MNPNDATKALSPPDLANQLFDAALLQYKGDPREAVRQVIVFLTETLVYAISAATAGDPNARQGLFISVIEAIDQAMKPSGTPSSPSSPNTPSAPSKP